MAPADDPVTEDSARPSRNDFIRQIIRRDVAEGKHGGRVVTRFPPEPNGYLHIGHAKSIVLNFGIAREFEGARCHLRFDDTNPLTEDRKYVEAIQEDVRWLGYDWGEHLYFASDYFERMYDLAVGLIRDGLAYVDGQSEEEIRAGRGTVTEAGVAGPDRDRPPEESLDLFRRMRDGEFADGAYVLRARIDMSLPNMLMRDPVLYRILNAEHYRSGDRWCVYPLYDYAHSLEDAFEGVTHSLCTLEFENNRELYDWVVENTGVEHRPRQYEFARLNLDYTVMSKRKLLRLVQAGHVDGWDDPRMPTVAGLRRRGVTPEAIRTFCEMVGVARADARVELAKLEYTVRDDLNRKAPRVMAVLRPLRVVLTNWPEGKVDELEAPYFPRDVPLEGSRTVPFSGELFIDREDFAEDPPSGFRRLVPQGEVRLRYGYIIRCEEVVKDEAGEVEELRCSVDLESRGGTAPDGRKVKGTIQWLSAAQALPCEVRLYDRLFSVPDPDAAAAEAADVEDGAAEVADFLNPESLTVVEGALVEPSVAGDPEDTRYQFERVGYFWRDPGSRADGRLVFNRIETLRDSWGKEKQKQDTDSSKRSEAKRSNEEDASRKASAGSHPAPTPGVRARISELEDTFGIGSVEAEILARDPAVAAYFRAAVAAWPSPESVDAPPAHAVPLANWIIHELPPVQGDRALADLPMGPEELAGLVALVEEGAVSSTGGGEALAVLAREGGEPRAVVERLDLAQVSDPDALLPLVREVLAAHPGEVAAYRGGKRALVGFFMGQVMRGSGGKADPELARELLQRELG
ncbi:MAG: glutamine--tRNA ligase/YqeY domain fusion protein [Gemmatimonadota bacterium]